MLLRSLSLPVLFLLLPVAVAQTASSPAYLSDPKFQQAMKDGKTHESHRQPQFAIEDFKKANKLAGGECLSCLDGVLAAQMEMASFKDALANYPRAAAAHYLDGETLARLGKMQDAKAEFTACLSCVSPTDPMRLRAEHFADDPELSTHKMAPGFEVTALDGSRFNLDAMGGRVVLIDFWATWCGPCNEELPHIKKIAKEFSGQPLVIISISWDADETKWKNFITKNEMTWVQYRDTDHKLSDAFGINAIPHYFTIDSDGVLTAEMLGSGSDVEGKLKKLIAKARESQATHVAAAQAAGD